MVCSRKHTFVKWLIVFCIDAKTLHYVYLEADISVSRKIAGSVTCSGAEQNMLDVIVGLFAIRRINFACRKGNAGFERKEYENVGEIKALFIKELLKKIDNPDGLVPPAGWAGAELDASAATETPMKDMGCDNNSPAPILAMHRAGFGIGCFVRERSVEGSLYKIVQIELDDPPARVGLEEVVELTDRTPVKFEVEVPLLISGWAVKKHAVTVPVLCNDFMAYYPNDLNGESIKAEECKLKVLKALLKAPHTELGDLMWSTNPACYYAARTFAVGELVLTP